MKTLSLLLGILISATGACTADANSSTRTLVHRNPGVFYGVIAETPANIILSQGKECSVSIEGEERQTEMISTEVRNGALVISGNNSRPVTIYVTVEDISLVEVNGAAKVFADNIINSDVMLLKVNGNGSIKMDVRALTLGMIVKGTGKIIASGNTGDSYIRVTGNGRVYASNLDSVNETQLFTEPVVATKKSRRLTLDLHR